MKAMSFKKWFSKILPCLENNSVTVLNSASYHPRKQEEIQAQPEIKK